MKRLIAAFAPVSVVLAFGAPLAAQDQKATNPVVIERMKTMEAIGAGMKTLVGMAKGEIAFDADAANAAVAAIAEHGEQVPAKFEANETDPASEALPGIWENWDDYVQKNQDMIVAAKAVGTIEEQGALGAALGQIGGTCKACHRDYRK